MLIKSKISIIFLEVTADHFSDIATLFSSCQNVVSADVPTALNELAQTIAEAGKATEFRQMTIEKAIEWLNSSESEKANKKFNEFLEKHGHRSIGEVNFFIFWSYNVHVCMTLATFRFRFL